jgi:hypothetical protein
MTQVGTTPTGGHYHQSSGVTSQNDDKPTVSLPSAMPTIDQMTDTVTLPDGSVVPAVRYKEDRSVTQYMRSEIGRMTQAEYAGNRDKIEEALALGQVYDDITSAAQRERQDKALRASSDKIRSALALRDARTATSAAFVAWKDAQAALDVAKRSGDDYEVQAAEQRLGDASAAFDKVSADLKTLEASAV